MTAALNFLIDEIKKSIVANICYNLNYMDLSRQVAKYPSIKVLP